MEDKLLDAIEQARAMLEAAEGTGPRGEVLVEVFRKGDLVATRRIRNIVTNLGLAWMSGALSGDTGSPNTMKYIAVGTGTTAAAATDTALVAEVESRATGTLSRVTVTTTNDTCQVVGTITMTGNRALTECGLFSAGTGGTMMARTVFSVINLTTDDTIQITWKVTFSRAA